MSLQVGGVIALMTVHLGGFESGYYAGLILVIIGVNLLMPWRAEHTAANTAIILGMYVSLNLVAHQQYDTRAFANNLFFLCGTAIISVAINHVRYRLIQSEFSLLVQLKHARDALWSEMELAKQIQMALLPRHLELSGYEVAVTMVPAAEVGGDYYEVMETANGDRYVAIGDVAGHGLDSGLIMMMAQTSVMTVVRSGRSREPAEVLKAVNAVLRENVGRLGSNHYMTMSVLKLDDHGMTVSGHHQDILIYRKEQSALEVVPTEGTWLGISDDITDFLPTTHVPLDEGDAVLLFTDGLTEAQTESGELYGMERLRRSFREVACEPVADGVSRIITDARSYQHNQTDDATVILIKKVAASRYAGADQEIHGGRT
jgi:serine phosphatase RsbU (regulator of sigma subunit)